MRAPDSRGWFSIGLYALSVLIIGILAWHPALAENHLFATIAQAVIITGLINLAASFEYGASKSDAPPPGEPKP